MTKSKSSIFTNERNDTDKSLTAEREKTNTSLAEARKLIEKETDLFVKNERIDTDQTRTLSREEADAGRDSLRKQSSDSTLISSADKASDAQLKVERRDIDIAIQEERIKADSALEQERELKKSKTEDVLKQERVSTDLNLSNERSCTDSEVESSSGRLSDEVALHLKTKASLTTRDEFLAIVSHDLRNPIGAISMCAQMALEDFGEIISPDLKKSLQMIERNATTGLRLISDILDMESIAMGQFQLQLKRTKVSSIIKEVCENFTLMAREQSTQLEVGPMNFADELICDSERVKQIITNLVANAMKFTAPKGFVRIQATRIDNQIIVSVHDNGPGIPDSKKIQIFERFAQLGIHDRRGLGLGLYISNMLTEAHQGRMWVESEVGKGSHFYVSLPAGNSPST